MHPNNSATKHNETSQDSYLAKKLYIGVSEKFSFLAMVN